MNIENILKDIITHEKEMMRRKRFYSHCMVCGEKLGKRKEYIRLDGELGWICPQCLEEFIEAER